MKLTLAPTSPYARFALASAVAADLAQDLEIAWINPYDKSAKFTGLSPAAKVPVLETSEGRVIAESTLIGVFLAQISGRSELIGANAAAMADVFNRIGQAKSAVDGIYAWAVEKRFGTGERTENLGRGVDTSTRIMQSFEAIEAARVSTARDLGDIAFAAAFDYASLRLPEIDPEALRAQSVAAAWWARVGEMDAIKLTAIDRLERLREANASNFFADV